MKTLVALFLVLALQRIYASVNIENCGISEVNMDIARIIGGRNAVLGEFPWQVSIKFTNILIPLTHLCGGAILNDRWIITAAHCVNKRSSRNFRVVVGIISQSDETSIQYKVEKIRVHEGFDPETFLNDIALIQLKKPLLLSKQVNGICLPPLEQNVTGYATSVGWGDTIEDGDMSDILQAVEVPLVSSSECEIIYGSDIFYALEMLCAGEPNGGMDPCQGDSGGPLIQRQNGRAILIGIISWGIGCARPGLPGVYTRVSNFVNWIEKNVQ